MTVPAVHEPILRISETFLSIQGEGKYLGHPSIFIRTSGCNLRCQWGATRCDTPYTSWSASGENLSISAIIEQVQALRETDGMQHVVITGGEPTLQGQLPALVTALRALDVWITLETNGTRYMPLAVDFVSLSPKLRSSVPTGTAFATRHARDRLNVEALTAWITQYDYQLKFVVDTPEDEADIVEILAALSIVDAPERVYLMPQGITPDEIRQHTDMCLDIGRRHGWNFSPRLHIELFGNTPGT